MSAIKIYHNPRCRKSRETLKLLEDNQVQPEVIEYLKEVPNTTEMKILLQKLGLKAVELVRRSEPYFKENLKGKNFSEEEWIQVMIENPKLIERPIVVRENKAVIGRPPENALDLI